MILRKNIRKGFTLLEALCVLAIIGILTSILMPTIIMARKATLKAKSKIQFHQYIFALEAYFREYNRYPYFFYEEPLINLKNYSEKFINALSGNEVYQKSYTSEAEELNSKFICFYNFKESEFNNENLLKDEFNNPNIYISIDIDKKGFQKIEGNTIREKIAIYTKKTDGNGYEDIQSWK